MTSGEQAMRTWRRGHHVFFVLTQGLVVTLALATEALRDGEWAQAEAHLELAITLLDASGSAMELAAEFDTADYVATIRPSMQAPALPTELSGVMSADHVALMTELAGLRTHLEIHAAPLRARFQAAVARLYDRHIRVCERFVADAPSLRSAGSDPDSAVHVLGRIRDRRVAQLGGSSNPSKNTDPT